ncbi:hypothetical protein JOM56_005886 [Amanita muscaria]
MMATVKMSRPPISSPLAVASDSPAHNPRSASASSVGQRRPAHFPTSRALRPFATISHVIQQPKSRTSTPQEQKRPQVKLIEAPSNQRMTFLLNLTQAELGRQG